MNLSSVEGFATKSVFTFEFSQWESDHYPLKVQLYAVKYGEETDLVGEFTMRDSSRIAVYETTLPMLDKVTARIVDSVGEIAETEVLLSMKLPNNRPTDGAVLIEPESGISGET
jgi:hypothetical protein